MSRYIGANTCASYSARLPIVSGITWPITEGTRWTAVL